MPGLSDLADGARADIDDGQLRRGVIVEQDLVEGVLEEVLVGRDLGFLAARDLDLGADGDARRDRGRAAVFRDERNDDAAAVGGPFDAAEDGVDDGGRQGLGGRRRDVDRPELDAAVDVAEQGDRPSVGRPGREGELDAVGQGDLAQEARLHVLEREAGREAQDLAAVVAGRDAHPGDPQDGLGDVGDRRHRFALDEGHRVAGRAHGDHGRRRRVDDVDDLLRRQLVGLLGGKDRGDGESHREDDGQPEHAVFQRASS